uniref:Interleukin 17 receptor E n=1 Tax=Pan paniscus TaxID=9597 RepID=A0A2R9A0A9_PANPA
MLAPFLLLLTHSRSPLSFRPCSHVPGALIAQKPMGSSRPAALLLPLLLIVIDLSDSAGIGFRHLPHWNTRCPLASHTDDSFTGESSAHIPCRTWWALFSTKPWCVRVWHCSRCLCQHLLSGRSGLQRGLFHLLVQKSKKSSTFKFYRRHKMPAPAQRKLLPRRHLSEKSHHISIPSPDISHKGLRSKRTQPSDPETWESLPRLDSQRHGGPEFSFDLLPEARAIRVTISSGLEVSVRLCHQWALECEELSSPYDVQKIVSGGHTVELPYEFLLPCLCIEASYLQEDTVRRKKCPFQSWPEAYGSDFWKSVHFTDYSQHTQMVMALTLRCPLKLEAALCQRHDWHTLCKDLPNATARESDGWYVLEKVDLHPQLCFKFSFGNSSHVECPHQTGSLTSWNVSMDTQAQQLILHFSSRMHATFSAAWSLPGLGQDTLVPPVYTVSQARGSSPVTLDLIIPFLRPGCCVLVWRSDVQFAWKHLLCPDVSYRHLGLLILALLALLTLLGVVLALTCRRPQSAYCHCTESLYKRLVGQKSSLRCTRPAWSPDPLFRRAREQGTVLLLWSGADLLPVSGPDPRAAPLLALLHAAPRPLLLLAYFSRLCAKEATSWGRLGARQRRQSRLELCSRLEREAARLADLG